MDIRGAYIKDNEQLFVFSDRSLVVPHHARKVLKELITAIGLNPAIYGMHSLRVGRTSDLIKYGYSVEEVR